MNDSPSTTALPRQIKLEQALYWYAKVSEEARRAKETEDFWRRKIKECQERTS